MATLAIRDLAEPPAPGRDLASRIRARFAGLGDVALSAAEREPARPPPIFEKDARHCRAAPLKGRARNCR